MARGFLSVYRTYNPLGKKNPVIDKMRTVLQDEGMFSKKRRQVLHEISGVSVSTFDGWFEGEVLNPRHQTIMATMSALGYEEQFVKKKDIDIDEELAAAAEWREKQDKKREAEGPAKRRVNGHRKPKK